MSAYNHIELITELPDIFALQALGNQVVMKDTVKNKTGPRAGYAIRSVEKCLLQYISMIIDKPYYLTFKLEPLEGDFWHKQYEDIRAGYDMNKVHWNSVKVDGKVPDAILMGLPNKADRTVPESLSGKKQKEILGDECSW